MGLLYLLGFAHVHHLGKKKNKEQVMLFLGFYSQRQWSTTKNKSEAVLIDIALDCTNLFPCNQASYASKNYLGTKVGNTINSKLYLIC